MYSIVLQHYLGLNSPVGGRLALNSLDRRVLALSNPSGRVLALNSPVGGRFAQNSSSLTKGAVEAEKQAKKTNLKATQKKRHQQKIKT